MDNPHRDNERKTRRRRASRSKRRVLEARWFLSPDEAAQPFDAIAPHFAAPDRVVLSASMRRVRETLLPAAVRQPGLFFITGERGVGKSFFAGHLLGQLSREGFAVASWSRNHAPTLVDVPVHEDGPQVILIDDAELLARRDLLGLLPLLDQPDTTLRLILLSRPPLPAILDGHRVEAHTDSLPYRGVLQRFENEDIRLLIAARVRAGEAPPKPEAIEAIVRHAEGWPAQANFLWLQANRLANYSAPRAAHVERAAEMMRAASVPRAAASASRPSAAPRRRRVRASQRRRSIGAYAAAIGALAMLWFAGGPIVPDMPIAAPRIVEAPRVAASASPSQSVATVAELSGASSNSPVQPVLPSETVLAATAVAPVSTPAPEKWRLAEAEPPETVPMPAPSLPNAETAAPPGAKLQPREQTAEAKHGTRPGVREQRRLQVASRKTPSPAGESRPAPELPAQIASSPAPGQPEKAVLIAVAEPQCRPYIAATDFAGNAARARGLACHDASGQWWLVNQSTE